jgi:nicotinic acid mononucleotide adenylyltransferase
MSEQLRINPLSDTYRQEERQGNAVIMIGSFAPIHKGHFDAVHAASAALTDRGASVESLILTPNSAEYVQRKLPEYHEEWTYERRVQEILDQAPHPHIPTYVDDVSGRIKHEQIILNSRVPLTVRRHLGFKAQQLYLVVGSDQLLSLESHLSVETNRAICVLRPNNLDEMQERLELPWVAAAVESERFIITEREDMENDVSSTAIRRSVAVE